MNGSPYMNLTEAAIFLRYVDEHGAPNIRAARKFLLRHRVAMKHRGRALLVHRDALDAALTPAGTSQPLTLVRRRA